ncbi:IDO domain containing protein [Trichuris trichiura]|uniref:IDO domain containing protein n=1 Tax=Trichuris trichiura TaxID=36087 RepID=A0A077ZDE9_TRITR|nr:IDO domain containing protein [Trichuris trichiura]
MPTPEDFHVSPTLAFVLERPLDALPSYYDSWKYCADNVRKWLTNGTIRPTLESLPLLHTECLARSHKQLRLAHLQLGTLVSAYIWCNGEDDVPSSLPCCLAVPYTEISCKLGIDVGIAPHTTVALANYKVKPGCTDSSFSFNAENYDLLHFKLLDDYSNDWFFLATLEVEVEFASTLRPLFSLVKAASDGNETCMSQQLYTLASSIRGMREKMQRLKLHLDPFVFFNQLRPFLSGTNQNVFKRHGGGIIFKGVGDEKAPVKLIGGSAAQSCTLQSLDAILAIEHATDVAEFLSSTRRFMLPSHRRFIEWLRSRKRSVRSYVLQRTSGELVNSYNQCISEMIQFRSDHADLVKQYIVEPRSIVRQSEQNLLGQTGTGGSPLMVFLDKTISSTKKSLIDQP